MNPVVHFELPYDDRERMCRFYQQAFGWRTRTLGEAMGEYVLATTCETGEAGPVKPGMINGGFFGKSIGGAEQPTLVIAVDDIHEAVRRVEAAGGEILHKPHEIPGVGFYVAFNDSEGSRIAMLQPIPRNWHAPESGPP